MLALITILAKHDSCTLRTRSCGVKEFLSPGELSPPILLLPTSIHVTWLRKLQVRQNLQSCIYHYKYFYDHKNYFYSEVEQAIFLSLGVNLD